jgi:hypothetical protein
MVDYGERLRASGYGHGAGAVGRIGFNLEGENYVVVFE